MIAVGEGEEEEEEAIRNEEPLQIVLRIVLVLIKASDFSFANTERSKNVVNGEKNIARCIVTSASAEERCVMSR